MTGEKESFECPECEAPVKEEETLCKRCGDEYSRISEMEAQQDEEMYGGNPLDPETWFGSEPDVITWADISKNEQ